jgi:hypothetical protein
MDRCMDLSRTFMIAPAFGLLVAGVSAHAQVTEDPHVTPEEGAMQSPGEVENAAAAGTLAGQVVRVDVPEGILVLRTNRGDVRVRAKPNRIRELEPGDQFIGASAGFGDEPWLAEERNPGVGLEAFGDPARMRGHVSAWDAPEGRLVLATPDGERVFSLHPAEAAALHQGRQVEVLYVLVDDEPWVISIRDRHVEPVQ